MFGELMRWNPSQELSNWHCDSDDLFGRFFERPEASLGSWMPRIETYRKDNDHVVRVDLPGLIPRTFRSMRKEMFCRFPANERQRRRGRIIRKLLTASLSGR
jgi:hypothetical protein